MASDTERTIRQRGAVGGDARARIPFEKFTIMARGGAHDSLCKPNTMQAMTRAWDIGVVPEADICTTGDRVMVLSNGVLGGRLRGEYVRTLPYEAVVAATPGLCRLDDVLAEMGRRPEAMIYLDCKDVDIEQLASLAGGCGVTRRVVLAGHFRRAGWRKLFPESETILWVLRATPGALHEAAEQTAGLDGITRIQFVVGVDDARLKAGDYPFTTPRDHLHSIAYELRTRRVLFQLYVAASPCPELCEAMIAAGAEAIGTEHATVAKASVRSCYDLASARAGVQKPREGS